MAVYRIVAAPPVRVSNEPRVVLLDNDDQPLLTGTLSGALDWVASLLTLPITITDGDEL